MKDLARKFTLFWAVMAFLCIMPLELYMIFGPEDGNPVGLGLLMMFGTPACIVLAFIGAVMWTAAVIREKQQPLSDQAN